MLAGLTGRLVGGGALCAALSACYVYMPMPTPEPTVGTQVSAELTNTGSARLAAAIGPGIWSVQGRVLANRDSDLVLSVRGVTNRGGEEAYWKGETLEVPKISVEQMHERRFSIGRSLVMAAGVVGASWLAWEAFAGGGPSDGSKSGQVGSTPR